MNGWGMAFGVLACVSANAAIAQEMPSPPLRDLVTDRPDKTESPYTVDAGHVQIELELANFTHDRTRVEQTATFGVAPINLKLGIARDADLQVIVEPYIRQTVTDRASGTRDVADGFGDVTIRVKRNLLGNDGGSTALGIIPFVKLPTNSGGVGNPFVEGGVIVPFAVDLRQGISLGAMTEVDLLASGSGRYSPSLINSATLGFDLSDALGLYTEVYTERSLAPGERWVVTFDTGVTLATSDNTQLDAGVNLGVTDAADDVMVFVGVSRKF